MDKETVIKKITDVFSQNFGDYTAGLYYKHYQNKEVEQIFSSAQELLSDILGPQKAAQTILLIKQGRL